MSGELSITKGHFAKETEQTKPKGASQKETELGFATHGLGTAGDRGLQSSLTS